MSVELGRTWCVRHGHLRFVRRFRQQRQSSNAQSGYMCAEAGATTDHTTTQFIAPVGGRVRRRGRRETERRRAGRRRIDFTLHDNFLFQNRTANARRFLFSGRGRRGTDWKGVATGVRAKKRTDRAKSMRRPWRTAAGRPMGIHDRRARHHESSSHRHF